MLSWCTILVFLSISQWSLAVNSTNYTPVVMWHGMGNKLLVVFNQFLIKKSYLLSLLLFKFEGDSCCFPFSLGSIKKLIEKELNNTVYVKSLEIGGSYVRDYESGYFIHPNIQVIFCNIFTYQSFCNLSFFSIDSRCM